MFYLLVGWLLVGWLLDSSRGKLFSGVKSAARKYFMYCFFMEEDQRTRLPIFIEQENPFLSVWELKVSLRQSLMVMFTFMAWFLLKTLLCAFLPIAPLFGFLLFIWLPLGGLFLAFKKKNGRPYEEHIANWLIFKTSDNDWINIDPDAEYGNISDVDWREIDDPYNMIK